MVMHKPGGTSTMLREEGFEKTMAAEFPDVVIAARQYGMAERAKARGVAENMLLVNHCRLRSRVRGSQPI